MPSPSMSLLPEHVLVSVLVTFGVVGVMVSVVGVVGGVLFTMK